MSPIFALCTMLGVLFCGLTLDLGMLEYTRLQMQRAADAAALGAQVSHDQEDPNWVSNGVQDAALNGLTAGSNTVTVSVVSPPTSGPYQGQYDVVQATVTKQYKTVFLGSVPGTSYVSSTTAMALETPCVYILGAHSPGPAYALSLNSGSSMGYWGGSSMGCPVYVNSNILVNNVSSLWVNATNVTGSSSSSSLSGGIFHTPRFGASGEADPLAYNAPCASLSASCIRGSATGIQAPTFSSCSYTNKVWTTGSTITLSPGTYCSSFNFTNSTVTLSPGLYIITGGATWTNSNVSGTGVTLYFTQKGDGNYGKFLASGTPVSLSAPTTSANGGIPTILMMNDPNWVQTTQQDFSFTNGSTASGDGIYYLRGTGLNISSSTFQSTHYLCFDVDNLQVTSSFVQPLSNFSPVPTGDPFSPMGGLVQ